MKNKGLNNYLDVLHSIDNQEVNKLFCVLHFTKINNLKFIILNMILDQKFHLQYQLVRKAKNFF